MTLTSPAPAQRTASLWLLALLPLVPVVLVFAAYRLPEKAEGNVVSLSGKWAGLALDEGIDPATLPASAWKELKLPGDFTSQGFAARHLWLRRSFTPLPSMVGHDAAFVLGNVRGAALRLFFNGSPVGVKGDPGTNFIGLADGAETYFIPAPLVVAGENTLTIEVFTAPSGRDGITDPRFLFGRREILGPWSFHEQQTRAVLEQGLLVLIATLALLLVVLWALQGKSARAGLYQSTLLLLFSASLYLMGKSGFLVTHFLDATQQLQLIVVSIFLLGPAVGDFMEWYFLQRTTWLRWANLSTSLIAFFFTFGLSVPTYRVFRGYLLWVFVLVVYCVAIALRGVFRRTTLFGPLAVSATLLIAGTAISDLLGDLDVLYGPRLFTFAVADMAIMSGAVLVAEFLQLAKENTRLSDSLQVRNLELADALVKTQEASRVKSEFLANTSHELRTPLNAIINIPQGILEQFHSRSRLRCGSCNALFELAEGEEEVLTCPDCHAERLLRETSVSLSLSPDETSRLLTSVVRSGKHLLAVVNDILDYSKLEAGRVVLYRERVTAAATLEDLRLSMEPVAQLAHVKLVTEAAPGLTLDVDRVKLNQVLINLVGNAIKFSEGKGVVTVRAAQSGDQVVLSVHDEGIGIAPEHQALIFEVFRQVEGSNTRRFGGSGLGLAISAKLVAMHGGTLRVESALEKGSTFFVELPLEPGAEKPTSTHELVVAIVDDERSAIDATTLALKPLACQVVALMDPREAVARLKEIGPALIVLDVMMPRLSGLEVLRAIRDDVQLRSAPVLVCSAYPDNERIVTAMGARFLAKPWGEGELLRLATELLPAAPRKAGTPS